MWLPGVLSGRGSERMMPFPPNVGQGSPSLLFILTTQEGDLQT